MYIFTLEYGVGCCFKTLASTEWPTSQLTLSKYVKGLTDILATVYSPNCTAQYSQLPLRKPHTIWAERERERERDCIE